jgi:catechol 2,3-dioxygenase-like lactoylglutathione lyase family enzyme
VSADSPIRIRDIDHVVLRTRDPQRLQQFYCDVLGCTIEKIQAGIGLTQLRAGRSLIDLLDVTIAGESAPQGARNMDHFCLRIEPFDADAISAFLRRQGIDPGEVASRYGADGQGPSIYLNDPDGNTVELKGPPWPA